jgi:benzoyl-CoA 2,3-dioxygenase component B
VQRWNKVIEKTGVNFRLKLPHVAFHRGIGEFANLHASPAGEVLSEQAWARQKEQWLPSKADGDFIAGLMTPCWEARRICLLDRPAAHRHRQQAG